MERLGDMPPANTGNNFETSFMTNPIISKLGKVREAGESRDVATYGGIGIKTAFFLLLTVVGVFSFFTLHSFFGAGAGSVGAIEIGNNYFDLREIGILIAAGLITIFMPMLAWLIRGTIPCTGSLYAISQGYVLSFSANLYGGEYVQLVWLALGITILIVASMLTLYVTRTIKVDQKFYSVIKVLFITSIAASITFFICRFIPLTAPLVKYIENNAVLSIGGSVVFIIIAALFLLSDFDVIEKTVEHQLPKKYEWIAAFGLVFTIIWLYLKVLNLLTRMSNKRR